VTPRRANSGPTIPTPVGGNIFEMRPRRITPLPTYPLVEGLFPATVHLGRATGSRAGDRVAFLVHGLGLNEDYFGLLAPELVAKGYDVWALRLPGYIGSGERAGWLWPVHFGLSVAFYGWVAASAIAHLARTLEPRPAHLLVWGHSLGAAALASAFADGEAGDWGIVDRLVLEAPAFSEALAFSGVTLAALTALPDGLLNQLSEALLMDDIRSSHFAAQRILPFSPGRASRAVLTMNALALANPFNRTRPPAPQVLDRTRFVLAAFDRFVDHDRLIPLLEAWRVGADRRLVLPRNHHLSLTSPREIVEWLERT
jgi:hypothetical protein